MINFKSWKIDEEDADTWATSFLHRTDDVGDYLNSESSNEDMSKFGSFTQRD